MKIFSEKIISGIARTMYAIELNRYCLWR